MKHNQANFRSMTLLLLAAGATVSSAAIAIETLPEITVQAERATRKVVGYDPANGAPVEKVTLARTLTLYDLDLTTTAGAKELERRVGSAAVAVCGELKKLFPLMEDDPGCVKKATDDGMKQANKIITAHAKAK